MVDTLSSQPASRGRGLAVRVIGVLASPRATYADVAAHPRWLGVFVVVLIATILPTAWSATHRLRPLRRPASARGCLR